MNNPMDPAQALRLLAEAVNGGARVKTVRGTLNQWDRGYIVVTCPYCARHHRFIWCDQYESTGLTVPAPCEAPMNSDPGVVRATRAALAGRTIHIVSPFWEPAQDTSDDDLNSAIPFFSAGLLR